MKRLFNLLKKHKIKTTAVLILLVAYYFSLPTTLFKEPFSTVIETENGELLGAKIADDGQWRFPEVDSVPQKFRECIVHFEDRQFYNHPGFNPFSMLKALQQNLKAKKTVRGGSTLTQQVIRLSRKGKPRTYFEKIIEIVLATRLELRHTKNSILNLYASHAPFGGNVVGLEMASWRYFGVQPHQLSWAESATLAVLPNAPSLIYPGKNQEQLLQKRNRLLYVLYAEKIIDSLTYSLSLQETLPQKPYNLPHTSPHLLQHFYKTKKGQRLKTTINTNTQQNINIIVKNHYQYLKQNDIHNAAVLVMEVATRKVVGYVGNTPTDKNHQKDVDNILASRSTGSILKPFLFAGMLNSGDLLPNSLVPDVPTQIAGYSPQNFENSYDGAVPASRALARSLNVPAVRLLQEYGLERFREDLKKFNLKSIDKNADHYGLTLILGGAESSLWDLSKTYASLASTVNHFNETSSEYFTSEFTEPVLLASDEVNFGRKSAEKTLFDAGSIYLMLQAMKEVNRPEGNESWEFFDSSKQVAWKTGTSFGNRDAWAIGVTKKYVVGVWVGNSDGEGRPGLTGVGSAAPIMFDVFNVLPTSNWFSTPYDELTEVDVCTQSGFLASDACPKKPKLVPLAGKRAKNCRYHHWVHLDSEKQFRVNSSCEEVANLVVEPWFTLPPLIEFYYKNSHTCYKTLPPFKTGCETQAVAVMDFIFPKENGKITLTKGFNGKTNELVLKLAHNKPESLVFWYVDDAFAGQTKTFHELRILPSEGQHLITVVDEFGNEIKRNITIN